MLGHFTMIDYISRLLFVHGYVIFVKVRVGTQASELKNNLPGMLASTVNGLNFVESTQEVVPARSDEGSTLAIHIIASHITSYSKAQIHRLLSVYIEHV